MGIFVLLKLTTAIILMARPASSKDNKTFRNVDGLFKTYVCNKEVKCPYVDVGQVIPQNLTCCKNLTLAFECSYSFKMQLSRYLNLLRSWNCSSQLETECKLETFNYNEYTDKVYLSVCNSSSFYETCKIQLQQNINLNATYGFYSTKKDFISDPCVSARGFYSFGSESFVEMFSPDLPLCPVVWCGFQRNKIKTFDLSYWDCAFERFSYF